MRFSRPRVLSPSARPRARCRGTAMVMVIIISMVVASLVMTMAWAAGVQSQVTTSLSRVNGAFYAAEAGLLRAVWYAKHGKLPEVNSLSYTDPVRGWGYTVTWPAPTNGVYTLTSVGVSGAEPSGSTTLKLVVDVNLTVPALAFANSLPIKNLTITGDVMVGQTMDFSSGTGQVVGNVYYGTAVVGTPSVTGSLTQRSFAGINFSLMQATLQSAVGPANVYSGDQTGTTFDFTAVPGTHPVIWVNGRVTDPVIVGSGTLVATSGITFTRNTTLGTASAPVNLVSLAGVNTQKPFALTGSVYAQGTWSRSQINITGVVYASDDVLQSSAGQSAIVVAQKLVPWYDPRTLSGGGGVSLGPFAGPTP